jgi:hypothetical protein
MLSFALIYSLSWRLCGYDLPLGWLFSTQSVNAVSSIIGWPQDCPQDDYGNGCLIVHVRNLLQPPAAQ